MYLSPKYSFFSLSLVRNFLSALRSLCLSPRLSVHLPNSLSTVFLTIHRLSVHLFPCPPVPLDICPSVRLSFPSPYLSSVRLFHFSPHSFFPVTASFPKHSCLSTFYFRSCTYHCWRLFPFSRSLSSFLDRLLSTVRIIESIAVMLAEHNGRSCSGACTDR